MNFPLTMTLLGGFAILLGGCAQTRPVTVLTAGHPAAAESHAVAYVPPSNPFHAAAGPEIDDGHDATQGHEMAAMPGMKPAPSTTGMATDASAGYVCPMHADVRSDEPGTCPKCSMRLVPAKADPTQNHEHGEKP